MKYFALVVGDRAGEVIPETLELEFPGEVTEEDPNPAPVTRAVPLSERYTAEFIAQLVPYDPNETPPQPDPALPPIPESVTMRQARLALLAAGKLAAVTEAIADLPVPDREIAQIEWEFAATVARGSPLVKLLVSALNIDNAQLDSLFSEAAQL